jgi:N,N-dimethylformamidase
MSDTGPPRRLFGYTSAFSACAGETLSFHVSGENVDEYVAQLVRLRHGHDAPGSLGLKETEVASAIDGPHPARFHEARPGSSVVVEDPDARLMPDAELEVGVLMWATAPWSTGRQGLLGAWSEGDRAGYALYLEQGHLVFVVGDGREMSELQIQARVQARTWYAITAGWSREDATVWVQQTWCDRLATLRGLDQPPQRREAAMADGPRSTAPFRIAALSERAGDRWLACSHFDGKLEAPWVQSTDRDATTRAAWRFELSSRPDGLLLDDVVDEASSGLTARTLNQPTRGVTGHNWSATSDSYRESPDEYGAIHFHTDDLADLEWPAAFAYTLPQELSSGVYAVRLRGHECEEHIPFFVRPAPDGPRNRVAVLFPTGSYLAYANDRLPFDIPGAELLIGHVPVLHSDDLDLQRHYDFGHSCYELHADGSGVVFSSRRRPIVNLRPRYRGWFMADAPWQFPADLMIVDWLDAHRFGWDAITDEDLHREGLGLLEHYAVVLTGSHPEYVSRQELDALEAYVSGGGRVMYLGGNGFYWLVSYHPERPYVMEVRRSENGSRPHTAPPGEQIHATSGERCGLWRNKGRAPQRLTGVGFAGEGFDRSTYYERLPDSFDPRVDFIFDGIGPDERIGDFGIVGGGAAGAEIDRYDLALGSLPETLVLASSIGHSDDYQRASEELLETPPTTGGSRDPALRSDLVYVSFPAGGGVFSTGSIAWTGSLSHNGYTNNVSTITANVLRRFLEPEPLP